jgi:hypothetical protein
MKITRSIETPKRNGLSFEELWESHDQGLIAAWERGKEMAIEDPELYTRAKHDELVVLPWRGGVEKAIKSKKKYGSMRYFAMWQGLRVEDLNIDTDIEFQLVCSKTNVPVTFTNDTSKYSQEQE